jgi:hypothetical protein
MGEIREPDSHPDSPDSHSAYPAGAPLRGPRDLSAAQSAVEHDDDGLLFAAWIDFLHELRDRVRTTTLIA